MRNAEGLLESSTEGGNVKPVQECELLIAAHQLTLKTYLSQRETMLEDIKAIQVRIGKLDRAVENAPESIERLRTELQRLKKSSVDCGSSQRSKTERTLETFRRLARELPEHLVLEILRKR